MAKKLKYAVVEFLSTKDQMVSGQKGYTYENEIGAKKYDTVVVPTRHGISMAVVVKLTDKFETDYSYGSTPAVKQIAEVIQSKEVAKVMNTRKKADLKKKLEAEVKKLDDVARFELYAQQSPEFAELLKEYKEVA